VAKKIMAKQSLLRKFSGRKIIAVVGLPGSGKSEAIEFLKEKYNLPKVYFGEVTFDEMKKRGLEINEKNERNVREDLRKKFGVDCYAQRMISKIKKIKTNKNILVESLYSWPEYINFRKAFGSKFLVIAVYASPKTRYKRLSGRKIRPLTPKETQSRDYAQIENLSQGGPIAIADYTIINEGDKVELLENAKKIYQKIKRES
jgi:dephospho-CoA kinase